MSIKNNIQAAMKDAMVHKDSFRLECLRMMKGALLLKEKEGPKDQELDDAEAIRALRAEIRKRQQSIETFRGLGREEEAVSLEHEIAIIEGFLPKLLSAEEIEARVRAHLAAHPEVNHAGKLTGAMKQELGELADGKTLNEICRRVLGA